MAKGEGVEGTSREKKGNQREITNLKEIVGHTQEDLESNFNKMEEEKGGWRSNWGFRRGEKGKEKTRLEGGMKIYDGEEQ